MNRRRSRTRLRRSRTWTPGCRDFKGVEIHPAGGGRGLHRLRALRGRLPGQEQDRSQAQSHQHAPAGALARCGAGELEFLPRTARTGPAQDQNRRSSASNSSCGRCSNSAAPARVAAKPRISRWCRNSSATARSSPTPPAAPPFTAATCRPRPIAWTRPAAARPGAIRCSRTTRSSGSASGSRSTSKRNSPSELVKKLAPQLGDDLVTGIVNAVQTDEAGIYEQRERVAALKQKLAKLDAPEAKTLLPIADTLVKTQRLDFWRRRLGLRHRLRRPGSRAGQRPRRQRARHGHGSLFQHGRPDVQVHAARRGGEIRRRRQTGGQEGPRPDRDELRQHLRGQRRDGRARTSRRCARSSRRNPIPVRR